MGFKVKVSKYHRSKNLLDNVKTRNCFLRFKPLSKLPKAFKYKNGFGLNQKIKKKKFLYSLEREYCGDFVKLKLNPLETRLPGMVFETYYLIVV